MGDKPLTVISVLRSGGAYDAGWVGKLKRGFERHLSVPHRFVCLSDCEVPCERIALVHDWQGWWAKLELFRPDVVRGPTLFCDLDNVLVGNVDRLAHFPHEFAMCRNLWDVSKASSTLMWFANEAPSKVYETFLGSPQEIMREYGKGGYGGVSIGDQGFIWDVMDRKVPFLTDDAQGVIRSYRRHCLVGIPQGCSVVAFGGEQKPNNQRQPWLEEHWQ